MPDYFFHRTFKRSRTHIGYEISRNLPGLLLIPRNVRGHLHNCYTRKSVGCKKDFSLFFRNKPIVTVKRKLNLMSYTLKIFDIGCVFCVKL